MIQLCFLTPYIEATARYVGTAAGNQEGVKKDRKRQRWALGAGKAGERRNKSQKRETTGRNGTRNSKKGL